MVMTNTPELPIHDFRSYHTRNLAWAILSPSLIQPTLSGLDDAFFHDIYANIYQTLRQQDLQADTEFSAENPPDIKAGFRLGLYFEHCWHQILELCSDLQLLAHNLPLRDTNKTLGEFDVILQDEKSAQQEHWELTLKYYLGVPLENGQTCWLGPNQKDQLERKYQRLIEHQLPLSKTGAAQTLFTSRGWQIQRRRILSKGMLFYPADTEPRLQGRRTITPDYIHTGHGRGTWLTATTFRKWCLQHPAVRAIHLPKSGWMSPPMIPESGQEKAYDLHTLETRLQHGFQRPVQLLLFDSKSTTSRCFVVPDEWLESAVSGRFPG